VGIPESELGHLFEKFYRVEANKNVAKGTGLGLNLVKQIIEKVHNGRVFVESKVGEGSTFGFELPLAAREAVEVTQR
jgi:signal transduction histidine kinase